MHKISLAPVLSATRSRDSCWITFLLLSSHWFSRDASLVERSMLVAVLPPRWSYDGRAISTNELAPCSGPPPSIRRSEAGEELGGAFLTWPSRGSRPRASASAPTADGSP